MFSTPWTSYFSTDISSESSNVLCCYAPFNVNKLQPTLVRCVWTEPRVRLVRPASRITSVVMQENPKESQNEVNLHLDSGPCCVSSCGPFRLYTHTHTHSSPLWYEPSMSNSLPPFFSSFLFQPTGFFLFWRLYSFNTSFFFCCLAQRHEHTPPALTVNAVWAWKLFLEKKKWIPAALCALQ